MSLDRAAVHRALGDRHRLAIVDAVLADDRSAGDLAEVTGLDANHVAFHLKVLERSGIVRRVASEGDARRRYVVLEDAAFPFVLAGRVPSDVRASAIGGAGLPADGGAPDILFVCTANSARSQLASHLWHLRTGARIRSAGTEPAAAVHPAAVAVGHEHGLDLASAVPRALADLVQETTPDLVISVCDRAFEDRVDLGVPWLHWSLPDPVPHGESAVRDTFAVLLRRIARLEQVAGLVRAA